MLCFHQHPLPFNLPCHAVPRGEWPQAMSYELLNIVQLTFSEGELFSQPVFFVSSAFTWHGAGKGYSPLEGRDRHTERHHKETVQPFL